MFYVYIIYSKVKDIYYKGCTQNLDQRIIAHNENKSRYTANKGPWTLVFVQKFDTKKEALVKEKSIKNLAILN